MSEHSHNPLPAEHTTPAVSGDPWNGSAQEVASAQPAVTTRRGFLFKVALGLNALVGTVLAIPILGYLVGPVLKKDEEINEWIKLGSLEDFPIGRTRFAEYVNPVVGPTDGMTSKIACWVRHVDDGSFQVFAVNCAHLGCPVRWFEPSHLFLCPCHGGAYYEDGSRASGPPTRGLFTYQHRVQNGALHILAGQIPTFATEACNHGPAKKGSENLVQTITADNNGRSAWNG